jgi:hypothetical protein
MAPVSIFQPDKNNGSWLNRAAFSARFPLPATRATGSGGGSRSHPSAPGGFMQNRREPAVTGQQLRPRAAMASFFIAASLAAAGLPTPCTTRHGLGLSSPVRNTRPRSPVFHHVELERGGKLTGMHGTKYRRQPAARHSAGRRGTGQVPFKQKWDGTVNPQIVLNLSKGMCRHIQVSHRQFAPIGK